MTRPGECMLAQAAPDLQRPFRLLAYGDPNIDLVFAVERAPVSDQKVLGRHLGRFAGGTVANAGCAAAALGCRTQAFGRVGDDADGGFLLGEYTRYGVDIGHVCMVAGAPSACAMIMLEPDGEKALVYAPLPGTPFEPVALRAALAASTALYAMPYDIDEFQTVHAMARAAGTIIAIDIESAMAPRAGDLQRLLALADVVFMNEASYRCLLGAAPEIATLRMLLGRDGNAAGPGVLVVTRGADGALAVSSCEEACVPAFAAHLVDSTGAGDCFNGAFLAALLDGGDLRHCLRFACAAASYAVTQHGARSGIVQRALVDKLLAPS